MALLLGCSTTETAVHRLDPAMGVVFPAERAAQLLEQCTRDLPGPIEGTWMPTPDQIELLESGLGRVLARALSQLDWPPDRPQAYDYYRQYGGIIVGGRRVIYVNGFHRSHVRSTTDFLTEHRDEPERLSNFPPVARDSNYWHHVVTSVCDGADHYFGVEYDPENNRFRTVQFNYPA